MAKCSYDTFSQPEFVQTLSQLTLQTLSMKQSKDTKLKEFQPNQNSALRDHVGFADQQMDNSPGASSPNYVQFPISLAHYMMYER